jgi:leucyl/phenylalanyl-tRNA--protein transferase
MPILKFPDPRQSTTEGIIALGGDLEPESLMLAYRQGIFPWPHPGYPLVWFCPPERAILEIDRLHISRSLARARKRCDFKFTWDTAFDSVISHCASIARPFQDGTWITEEMVAAYRELHRLGHAHSLEVWNENELVGGIYGVDSGGVFSGESMFYLKPNASKFAILYLLEFLSSKGLSWIDIQVMTPHMEALGARLIPRDEFLTKLENEFKRELRLFEN